MQFLKIASFLATAALATAANTVTFLSQDHQDRTVYWTGNPQMAHIADTRVPGNQNVTISVPDGWVGNFYAVADGSPKVPGMLGEVAFNGWMGITYFDVSAIVNPNDKNGVKQMWPKGENQPVSGCVKFPCAFAYYAPDDVQTRATMVSDLFCSLGNSEVGITGRAWDDHPESPAMARDFVQGKWTTKGHRAVVA
ncbi:DNase1 protein [Apodospora peruviana]|uniref:DNase1 protein n=1 Tax=Apodospora peruviana TaxID=516989 RepID=A0AAE0MBA9_9PEZI|nr:DNase1 protein [Apodospora peruviana]